ncbi:SacI homology domain-containing protein [Coprinopsis sp. MPI-PUGE-AT-0042]|nr:SacI homology domain-containing protein [Coprinopsis sp. MPI-PUGE-AT-0042]
MKKFFAKATKPFAVNAEAEKDVDLKAEAARLKDRAAPGKTGNAASSSATAAALHAAPGLKPKYVLPAVPQPYPWDHLAILPTAGGLLVRPFVPGQSKRRNPVSTHLKIGWKSGEIVEVDETNEVKEDDWVESVVVYGIVGMLDLFSCPYLLVIHSRTEVGTVLDPMNVVYALKGVTAIPLWKTGQEQPSILPRRTTIDDPTSPFLDEGLPERSSPKVQFAMATDVKVMTPPLTPIAPTEEGRLDPGLIERPPSAQSFRSDISSPSSENSMVTSPVFKTLAQRLSFWDRTSKRSNSEPVPERNADGAATGMNPSTISEERVVLDKLIEKEEHPHKVVEAIIEATAPPPATADEKHKELEEKVVRECIGQLTKGGMYWAYTFGASNSIIPHSQISKKHELLEGLGALGSDSNLPSPKEGESVRVDKQFWWNEWMSKPFVDAGLHPYVLPIMQGYFQPATLHIPPSPTDPDGEFTVVDYTIISRRARYRVGLRYQRRGIDDEAHVANFVETETVMKVERENISNIFSYVQIRGSIPLYWTQSGYSLKPPPTLAADRTHQQNQDALSRHFKNTIPIYGPHTVVNLAEQGGREGALSHAYKEHVVEFDNKDVQYCDYDFHHETKGMKYEKISSLVDSMQRTFETQGFLWISDETVLSHQKGVFRVNCIDCLDRTNVVQSAFARFVMNQQLSAVGLLTPSLTGSVEADLVFNDVWANNGDAISRAYAGTSALKGDFTRTGKRDLSGMLNDGMNSLARMYTSTFSDWFSQAVIDFMLGSRTRSVFSEFLLKLQSTDPRDLIRLSKIRAEAIATATSRVLPDDERLISGWTLFSPEELNVWVESYDYSLEKVKLYTRVPLGEVVSITKGAYILSPLEEASRDPEQNYGFVITWLTSHQESRATSYSVRNDIDLGSISNPSSPITETGNSPGYPIPIKSPTPGSPPSYFATTLIGRSLAMKRNLTSPPARSTVNTSRGTTSSKASTKAAGLSLGLSLNDAYASSAEKSFAAFKVLPIDPARIRRSSSSYSEMSDELLGASTCKEAADLVVETIVKACEEVGSAGSGFVSEEEIVSLAEAQRMTTVYAKMEYGLKRLLWLGG